MSENEMIAALYGLANIAHMIELLARKNARKIGKTHEAKVDATLWLATSSLARQLESLVATEITKGQK